MKKYGTTACALVLTAVLFTGCGCSNSKMEPTIMPTTQATTIPTTRATTAPTMAPTTMPTTEAPSLPTETGNTENTGIAGSTEATNNARSDNRMPSHNGK